jgi:hypothetical protein
MDFPLDLALITEEHGCTQCGGYPIGIRRTYLDSRGDLRSEELAGPDGSGAPLTGSFVNFGYGTDGWRMAAAVCIRGGCGTLQYPTTESVTAIFLSTDGGASWQELVRLDGGAMIAAVVTSGVVVRQGFRPDETVTHTSYPHGTPITPPPGASTEAGPLAVGADELAWFAASLRDFLGADGAVIASAHARETMMQFLRRADAHGRNIGMTVTIMEDPDPAVLRQRVTFGEGGRVIGDFWFEGALRVPSSPLGPAGVAMSLIVVPGTWQLQTGFTDLDHHTFHPLRRTGAVHKYEWLVAVQYGPFARVNTSDDCLNLRRVPFADAEIAECAADGALLLKGGLTRVVDGQTWESVGSPGADGAWADVRFLER